MPLDKEFRDILEPFAEIFSALLNPSPVIDQHHMPSGTGNGISNDTRVYDRNQTLLGGGGMDIKMALTG